MKTKPGTYYRKLTPDGPLLEAPAGTPHVVICRRVADYPGERPPTGAGIEPCHDCGAPIAFDPHGPHLDRPKTCMQCCGIQPLPFEPTH